MWGVKDKDIDMARRFKSLTTYMQLKTIYHNGLEVHYIEPIFVQNTKN